MRILSVGAGHVGLATAVGFARRGHQVRMIEVDSDRIRLLRAGELPFEDPTLEEGLKQALGSTLAVLDWEEGAGAAAEVAFICVNTPPTSSGALDVSHVHECARRLAAATAGRAVLVVRSTVNPGTALAIEGELRERWPGAAVLANPEFLREGRALVDFEHPDRRVVGGSDRRALRVLRELYAFSRAPILVTDATGAELIKLASNAALAVRVSLANEIAALAVHHDADPARVLEGVGADARLGSQYFRAGLGFGGNCLPKDLDALWASARAKASLGAVLDAAATTNEQALEVVCARVIEELSGGRRACVVGLGFKPGSHSVRGSRALLLVRALLREGVPVAVYDPVAAPAIAAELGDAVEQLASLRDCAADDVVVLAQGADTMDLHELRVAVVLDAIGRRVDVARTMEDPRAELPRSA